MQAATLFTLLLPSPMLPRLYVIAILRHAGCADCRYFAADGATVVTPLHDEARLLPLAAPRCRHATIAAASRFTIQLRFRH